MEADRIAAVERSPRRTQRCTSCRASSTSRSTIRTALAGAGLPAYLLATRAPVEPARRASASASTSRARSCSPEAAGAIPVEELRPVDLAALEGWLAGGRRSSRDTLAGASRCAGGDRAGRGAPESSRRSAIRSRMARPTRLRWSAGVRFATHLWNAFGPVRARATGAIPELLLDPRVILGLIADGRHLHPQIEELTVRAAGHRPHRADERPGAAARPDPRRQAARRRPRPARRSSPGWPASGFRRRRAWPASSLPGLLGLDDRGRLAPGFRADLAVLDEALRPLETLWKGRPSGPVRYPQTQIRGRNSA